MTHQTISQESELEKAVPPNCTDQGDFVINIDIDSRATTAKDSMVNHGMNILTGLI